VGIGVGVLIVVAARQGRDAEEPTVPTDVA
jgi:hypothetical protein